MKQQFRDTLIATEKGKGFRALSEGMMALPLAKALLHYLKQKRQKNILKAFTHNLLAAQAAEIAGEAEHAEEIYKELILDPTKVCWCKRDHEKASV